PDTILGPGAPLLRRLLRPVAHNLSAPVTATLTRRRQTLGGATVLVALSFAFAASTAVFNATYRHQVALGALLTNGADVAVTEPPGARPAALDATSLARVRGVRHVEALEHRFVSVGAALQDVHGGDPRTTTAATHP